MDYIQKYNAALEKANIAHKDEDRHLKATLERIFPELKEFEDEKLRKSLIKHFRGYHQSAYFDGFSSEEVIAWLEKQGNIWKPTKEQVDALTHFVRSVGESGYASPYDNNTKLLYSLLTDLQVLEKQGEQKELSQSKVTKISDKDDDLDALGQAIYALESFVVEDKPNKCFAGHHVPFIKAIEILKSLKNIVMTREEEKFNGK